VDFIKALLKTEDTSQKDLILNWLFSGGFFDNCIDLLHPNKDPLSKDNASEILVILLAACGSGGEDIAIRPYESKEAVDKLLGIMFDENGLSTTSYNKGIDCLIAIIDVLHFPAKSTQDEPHPFIASIVPHLEKFKNVLTTPLRSRVGSFGEIKIAGETVVNTVKFLTALMAVYSAELDDELISLQLFRHCMSLFFKYALFSHFCLFNFD